MECLCPPSMHHTHAHTLTHTPSQAHTHHTLPNTLLHTFSFTNTCSHTYIFTYIHIHHHTYHILTNPPHGNICSYPHTCMLTQTLTTSHTSTTYLYSNTVQRLVEGPESSFICIRSHSTTVYSSLKTAALGQPLWLPSPRLSS